ncbi:PEP-CTERM sorting domain-containing protein [Rubritalea tangerina]|uniref:PEP-CTERM sorting domain-containing protein n=1 Tax=Rubritalea tangerina TaxID=430798 RepID=A0ABW4Z6U8_9BACT
MKPHISILATAFCLTATTSHAAILAGISFYRNSGNISQIEDPNNPGTSLITALGTSNWYAPLDPNAGTYQNGFGADGFLNVQTSRNMPGVLSGLTLTWTTGATWASGSGGDFTGTSDENLVFTEFFDDNSGAGITVNLSGIQSFLSAGQSLVVRAYSNGAENSAGNPTFNVTQGTLGTPNDYLNPDGSGDGKTIYEVAVSDITDDSWTISVPQRNTGGNTTTNFAAITIEVVPEPSIPSLMGLCGVALILRRRRNTLT